MTKVICCLGGVCLHQFWNFTSKKWNFTLHCCCNHLSHANITLRFGGGWQLLVWITHGRCDKMWFFGVLVMWWKNFLSMSMFLFWWSNRIHNFFRTNTNTPMQNHLWWHLWQPQSVVLQHARTTSQTHAWKPDIWQNSLALNFLPPMFCFDWQCWLTNDNSSPSNHQTTRGEVQQTTP